MLFCEREEEGEKSNKSKWPNVFVLLCDHYDHYMCVPARSQPHNIIHIWLNHNDWNSDLQFLDSCLAFRDVSYYFVVFFPFYLCNRVRAQQKPAHQCVYLYTYMIRGNHNADEQRQQHEHRPFNYMGILLFSHIKWLMSNTTTRKSHVPKMLNRVSEWMSFTQWPRGKGRSSIATRMRTLAHSDVQRSRSVLCRPFHWLGLAWLYLTRLVFDSNRLTSIAFLMWTNTKKSSVHIGCNVWSISRQHNRNQRS